RCIPILYQKPRLSSTLRSFSTALAQPACTAHASGPTLLAHPAQIRQIPSSGTVPAPPAPPRSLLPLKAPPESLPSAPAPCWPSPTPSAEANPRFGPQSLIGLGFRPANGKKCY